MVQFCTVLVRSYLYSTIRHQLLCGLQARSAPAAVKAYVALSTVVVWENTQHKVLCVSTRPKNVRGATKDYSFRTSTNSEKASSGSRRQYSNNSAVRRDPRIKRFSGWGTSGWQGFEFFRSTSQHRPEVRHHLLRWPMRSPSARRTKVWSPHTQHAMN